MSDPYVLTFTVLSLLEQSTMTTDIKELVKRLRDRREYQSRGHGEVVDVADGDCEEAADALEAMAGEVERLRADKDIAYSERNQLVAFLTRCFPSWRLRTDIPGWMPEWHGCVYIETPEGQLSWHYHDRETHLFAHLDQYPRTWDGHTTEDKYQRLARLQPDTAERDRLKAALDWALGEGDEWPERKPGEGAFYWRAELRRKALGGDAS